MHYQPIIDLARGASTVSRRWSAGSAAARLVAPDAFIVAAEESGLIAELGERVLARMVEDAPALALAAGRPLTLGCNMSAHQLRDPGFLDLVAQAVTAAWATTGCVLEMTETVVVADDDETD